MPYNLIKFNSASRIAKLVYCEEQATNSTSLLEYRAKLYAFLKEKKGMVCNILRKQDNPKLEDEYIEKFYNDLCRRVTFDNTQDTSRAKNRRFYVLFYVLSAIELHSGIWHQTEYIDRLYVLFNGYEQAEKFLEKFYAHSQATLKLEQVLEIASSSNMEHLLKSAATFSKMVEKLHDTDFLKNFKKLKMIVKYLPYTIEYTKKLQAESSKKYPLLDQIDKYIAEKSSKDKLKQVIKKDEAMRTIEEHCFYQQAIIEIQLIETTGLDAKSISILTSLGVSTESCNLYSKLEPRSSDHLLPNVVVSGEGYYICKLSADDPRGPFLGLLSACCQHLDGEGCTAARYGYTEENSCFYVMFKGNPQESNQVIDTKTIQSKNIVAQSWAWRMPGSNELVLDSIEMENANVEALASIVKKLYIKLGDKIISQEEFRITEVSVGNNGRLKDVGIFDWTRTNMETPLNPWYIEDNVNKYNKNKKIYSDATCRYLISDAGEQLLCQLELLYEPDPSLITDASLNVLEKCHDYLFESMLGNLSGKDEDKFNKLSDLIVFFYDKMTCAQKKDLAISLSGGMHDNIYFAFICLIDSTDILNIEHYLKLRKFAFDSHSCFTKRLMDSINYDLINLHKERTVESYRKTAIIVQYMPIETLKILIEKKSSEHLCLYSQMLFYPLFCKQDTDLIFRERFVLCLLETHPEILGRRFGKINFIEEIGTVNVKCHTSKTKNDLITYDKSYSTVVVDSFLAYIVLHESSLDDKKMMDDIILKLLSACSEDDVTSSMSYNAGEGKPVLFWALDAGLDHRIITIIESNHYTRKLLNVTDPSGRNIYEYAVQTNNEHLKAVILRSKVFNRTIITQARDFAYNFAGYVKNHAKILIAAIVLFILDTTFGVVKMISETDAPVNSILNSCNNADDSDACSKEALSFLSLISSSAIVGFAWNTYRQNNTPKMSCQENKINSSIERIENDKAKPKMY